MKLCVKLSAESMQDRMLLSSQALSVINNLGREKVGWEMEVWSPVFYDYMLVYQGSSIKAESPRSLSF